MTATSFKTAVRAFILVAAAAVPVLATAPGLMTYQGRIKESGLPVTGVRTVDVQICDSFSGGTCNTTGGQGVSVSNGLFRTTFTIPSGVTLETGSWFIEIHVGGSVFGPREQLSAGAYAIYASSASTLIVNPGNAAVYISPSVVIAGNGFSVGGSTLVVSGGNVGIGTNAPGATLGVNGTINVSGVGHVRVSGGVSLPAPGGSGCGTGATVTGSDGAGRVTIGASPSASCQIVFGTAWSPNAPVCYFTNESSHVQPYAVSSVSTLFVTFQATAAFNAGDTINYMCLSY